MTFSRKYNYERHINRKNKCTKTNDIDKKDDGNNDVFSQDFNETTDNEFINKKMSLNVPKVEKSVPKCPKS